MENHGSSFLIQKKTKPLFLVIKLKLFIYTETNYRRNATRYLINIVGVFLKVVSFSALQLIMTSTTIIFSLNSFFQARKKIMRKLFNDSVFIPKSETQRELSLTWLLSAFGTAHWTFDNNERMSFDTMCCTVKQFFFFIPKCLQ